MLDENGVIAEANLVAAAALGHERARLVGKPLAALIQLADRRAFRTELGGLAPGERVSLQIRPLAHDRPWHLTLRALPRTGPRAIAVSLRSEGGLPEPPEAPRPGERFEHLIVRFPQAAVALRPDLRVAFANGKARRLLGLDAVRTGSLFGEGLPEEVRRLARRLVSLPAPLPPTNLDLEDGRALRVSGVAATQGDPAVLFIEDTTDAVQRDRVLREFLRNAAHQLRTPLTGITAAIETLQNGAKDDPSTRDRFLGHLEAHAQRLSRIARGLLMLARAQSGEVIAVDMVELKPLVESVVSAAAPREGVEIVARCPRGLAAIAAPELLQEALAALVENALEHTRVGEVRISAAETRGAVSLTVADSGAGILPEFQERVFEPFYRVAASGNGFGLGLAIAAEAVAAMHGQIGVWSQVGKGTMFTMTLPSAMGAR